MGGTDRTSPMLRDAVRGGVHGECTARTGGPPSGAGASQIQQLQRPRAPEAGEVRSLPPAVDDAGVLIDLGERAVDVQGALPDASSRGVVPARIRMGVEAQDRAEGPQGVPRQTVGGGRAVSTPEDLLGRDLDQLVRADSLSAKYGNRRRVRKHSRH